MNLCEPEAPATLRRCSQICSVPRYRSRPRGWPSAGAVHHPETTGNTETPAVTDICSSFNRLLRAVFTSECLSKIYPTINQPDQYQSIRYSTAILWTFGDILGLWTLRSDSGLHTDMVICTTSQDSPINGPQWLCLKIMGEKNDHWWVIWQLYAIMWLLFGVVYGIPANRYIICI